MDFGFYVVSNCKKKNNRLLLFLSTLLLNGNQNNEKKLFLTPLPAPSTVENAISESASYKVA